MSSQKFLSPAWRNGKIRSPTIMIRRARSPFRLTAPAYLKSMHAGEPPLPPLGDLGLTPRRLQGPSDSVHVESVIPRANHSDSRAQFFGRWMTWRRDSGTWGVRRLSG